MFGGWQSGRTVRAIDSLHLTNKEFKPWNDNDHGELLLKQPDMITKPILRLSDSVIAVQGRKYIHLVDIKSRQSEFFTNSGEDQAELDSLARQKILTSAED